MTAKPSVPRRRPGSSWGTPVRWTALRHFGLSNWTPAYAGEQHENGFSLIEALVALLILAITTVGLIRAAEAHVDSVRGMERRAAAQFVAENRLVELRLGVPLTPEAEMLGTRWRIDTTVRATADPDLRAVTVTATAADGVGATLDGFVDTGTTTR